MNRAHAPSSERGRGASLSPEDIAYVKSLLIHDDAQLLAFNKPSGLAVQGGSGVGRNLEDLLAAFAKSNGKRPHLVHRLDRDTSGVVVAARTKPAAARLSAAFAGREAQKTYLAIVCGAPDPRAGAIDLKLTKASRRGLDIMEVAPSGLEARTVYQTLAAVPGAALLELKPETGRMHQLRAHLAAIGAPIAGDGKYGGLFQIGAAPIPRLLLHAWRLDLPHPAGGRLALAAPVPDDFVQAARSLRIDHPAIATIAPQS